MQIQYSANQPACRYNFPARVAAKELWWTAREILIHVAWTLKSVNGFLYSFLHLLCMVQMDHPCHQASEAAIHQTLPSPHKASHKVRLLLFFAVAIRSQHIPPVAAHKSPPFSIIPQNIFWAPKISKWIKDLLVCGSSNEIFNQSSQSRQAKSCRLFD